MKTNQVKYTTKDFEKEFPNDDACLEWVMNHRFPNGVTCVKCGKVTKHHKVTNRKVYECDNCGTQISPTANTIFHKSDTPLRVWFQVIYRMASTRCGISAKQVQRETGVTYKTAWRMFKQIRTILSEPNTVGKEVELDETFFGGKAENMHQAQKAKLGGPGTSGKTPVFGAVERGGKVVAIKVANVDQGTLLPHIDKHVAPESTVYTDEMGAYAPLTKRGYRHEVVKHSGHEYVRGNVHTNTIEGFWSLVKRGIDGVYHSVSPKYLQSYVDEYSFRYNHRKDETPMFQTFLNQIPPRA
jgi:transposase-like protein/transcription elongation factor Elf1